MSYKLEVNSIRITDDEMEVRRDRMIHVAYQLFNKYGIDGTSLEKIAKAAGVSPKSIFRYFKNKAQLVEQTQVLLWKEIVGYIIAHNLQARQEAKNGFEELKIILYGFEELYKDHRDYIMFAYNYQSYCIHQNIKLSQEHLEKTFSDVRPVFMRALERGQKDGSISVNLPPLIRFWMIWGVMRSYIEKMAVHAHLYTGENPWEKMFPQFLQRVLESLMPTIKPEYD